MKPCPLTEKEISKLSPFWKEYFSKWGRDDVYGEWTEPNTTNELKFHKEYYMITTSDKSPNIDNFNKEHSILKVQIDEFVHSSGMYWLEKHASFAEIKTLLKIFCRWSNTTPEDLWEIYNSENRDYLTNIPLLNKFIKDCNSDSEIESMIRGLIN
jgi:hypothetical protein